MREIHNHPDYYITEGGEVYSTKRNGMRLLKQVTTNKGYNRVSLGSSKLHSVHRLVAEAYIPNPDNHPHINHIDEDKSNNSVSNLEWCNPQQNKEHSASKWVKVMTPEGEILDVFNLRKFCRENNLDRGNLNRSSSKGYRLV